MVGIAVILLLVCSGAAMAAPVQIPEVLLSAKASVGGGWLMGGVKEPVLSLQSTTPLTEEQWAAVEALGIRSFTLSGKAFGNDAMARLVKIDPTALFLFDAPITDAGAVHFGEMKSLRALTLVHAGGGITTATAGAIENHPSLEVLIAPAAWAADPESFRRIFSSCKRLRFTQLGHHLACDTNCASLEHHPSIADIYLGADPNGTLSDAGIVSLATMPELKSLHVYNTRLTYDGSLKHLKNVPKLATLGLSEVCVSDDDLERLKADLPGVAITYSPMKPDMLKKLEMAEAVRRGQESLKKVADVLAPLKPSIRPDHVAGAHLTLVSQGPLTAEQWSAVASTGIRSLGLAGGCADDGAMVHMAKIDPIGLILVGPLTDAGMARLADMRSLRALSMSQCPAVTAASAAVVANHPTLAILEPPNAWTGDAKAMAMIFQNPRLESISLTGKQVSDASVGLFARHPSLEQVTLNAVGSAGLTNAGLVSLSTLPKLTRITVSSSRFTYDGGLEHLAQVPGLTSLVLSQVVVSQEDIDRLKAAAPKVQISFTPMPPNARDGWEKIVAARDKAIDLLKRSEPERAAALAALQASDPAASAAVQAELRYLPKR